MLTIDMLKVMPFGTIFATNVALDNPDGLFMANTGKELRWVAVRGHGHLDWAIYCDLANRDMDWIRDFGNKVNMETHIKKLVECDDEAFKQYRH